MSVYDQNAFQERVTHAFRCINSGNMDSRAFDTCFEMFDGDVVATALTRKADRDPDFKERVTELWGGTFPPSWLKSTAQWYFSNNEAKAHNAVRAQVSFKVYEYQPATRTKNNPS